MGGPVRVLVVGDAILDCDVSGQVHRVAPDAPVPVVDIERRRERPGGAGLTARLLARSGVQVRLAAPLGADTGGSRLRDLIGCDGVACLPLATLTATRCVTRVRSAGQSLVRFDECAGALGPDDPVDLAALRAGLDWAGAVVVADYGGGLSRHRGVRELLADWARRRIVVWDPHPRGGPPVPGVTVATPNHTEALGFAQDALAQHGPASGGLDRAAEVLRRRWKAGAVAATDGSAGVYVAVEGERTLFVPVPFAVRCDPCGAGDRFAASVAAGLARGASTPGAVAEAVTEVAAWLADGGVGDDRVGDDGVGDDRDDAAAGPSHSRRAEQTVVATGGCFDVLHAGHVASLQAARRLGDRLVVLVNSDSSVRRLKGPRRPVHTAQDRARVLASLECVDEVRVFDDDTPEAALRDLRPDIWAKGSDYSGGRLPEAELVQSWGGRVVLLPFLPGHSTTRILTHTDRPTNREQSA